MHSNMQLYFERVCKSESVAGKSVRERWVELQCILSHLGTLKKYKVKNKMRELSYRNLSNKQFHLLYY